MMDFLDNRNQRDENNNMFMLKAKLLSQELSH